jgi:hypothetical protein
VTTADSPRRRRARPVAVLALIMLVLIVPTLATSSGSRSQPGSGADGRAIGPPASPLDGDLAYVLTSGNQVLAITPDGGGRVIRTVSVGPPGSNPPLTRHALAMDPGRGVLYVLVSDPVAAPTVVALDARTLALRARFRLPRGIAHRAIAAGAGSGRLFVAGDRGARMPDAYGPGPPREPVLTVVAHDGRVSGPWALRGDKGRDWIPYAVAATADERHIAVSYHGTDTTGADIAELSGGQPAMCRPPDSADHAGCVAEVHGRVLATSAGFVAATGSGESVVVFDHAGTLSRQWNPRLPGNHLMEFDVDADATTGVAVGECEYAGGIARIDPTAGTATIVGDASKPEFCGDRIALITDRLALITQPVAPPRAPEPAALLLDLARGTAVRISLPEPPVDMIA